MLILSRKLGERVMIGRNVAVTVVEIRGDRIKLAFDAPDQVRIYRQEVFHRIQSEEQPTRSAPPESPYIRNSRDPGGVTVVAD